MAARKREYDPINVDYEKANELAERAVTLAQDLLELNQETRRQVVDIFVSKDWNKDDIKKLVMSASPRIFRKIISRRFS